jgi:hypothetical protein
MFLADTNVWLEVLLEQQNADAARGPAVPARSGD